MADTSIASNTPNGNPPLAFVVAVWLGMPHADIERGLREGWVARPPGAPADWMPQWGSGEGSDSGGDGAGEPPDTGGDEGGGHDAAAPKVDRAQVERWFRALDPEIATSTFDAVWRGAGSTDAGRATALFGFLRRALLGEAGSAPGGLASVAEGADPIGALSTFLADPGHRAHVVSLAGKNGAEIAALARGDIGARYALAHLDTIALTGNRALFATANADGSLDRFDPDTGEQNLTDARIGDRAKFLAWKMRADAGGELATDGDTWVFLDRTLRDADGNPLKLEIAGNSGTGRVNQVIFGADVAGGEALKGGTGTDRIYGGSGDDVIRGSAGSDHLEGGRGDDLVLGGSGDDELVGGQGADELDGGSGADRLAGNAGDDTLAGGRGDDRLDGGAGHDVYVVDPGDGNDTIVDADGDGEVQFDGVALGGATRRSDGKFVSSDGRAVYSLSGGAGEGGMLTVELYGPGGAGGGGSPVSTIRIQDWKNGALGITLGDGSEAAPTASDAQSASDGVANLAASADEGSGATTDAGSTAGAADTGHVNDAGAAIQTEPDAETTGDSLPGASSTAPEPAPQIGSATNENALDPATTAAMSTDGIALDASAGTSTSGDGGPLEAPDVGAVLVDPEAVDAALRAFGGVPEAPDVGSAPVAAPSAVVGVTPLDVSSAMLDFHDASDAGHDQAGSEPLPVPLPTLTSEAHASSIVVGGAGVGVGSGSTSAKAMTGRA